MTEAFIWGLVAASSLIIGAILAIIFKIPRPALGLIMAFGVGVLISAVSFELIEEAFQSTNRGWAIAVGLISGAVAFTLGNFIIDHLGGRKHRKGDKAAKNSGLAILLGTVLDGIPESIVIGLSLVKGGSIGIAVLVAVFLSNLPEAIAATSGLKASGWNKWRIIRLWTVVALISGLASLAGYLFFDQAGPEVLGFTLAFAGGALLTMLATTMMPDAFRDSGKLVGLVTTLGFGLAYLISVLT